MAEKLPVNSTEKAGASIEEPLWCRIGSNSIPGGNGVEKLNIPAGTRLSVKAISATANVGELTINCLG